MRPLPMAPRPFMDEALGSWIGRLAARYRMSVVQLDTDYQLGLSVTGPLSWLLPGRLSERSHTRLSSMARLPAADIASLAVEATDVSARGAPYCRGCVFLSPVEVESPYWKRGWLSLDVFACAIHALPLTTLPASRVRNSGNMLKLIQTAGKYERELRERGHPGGISKIREPISRI